MNTKNPQKQSGYYSSIKEFAKPYSGCLGLIGYKRSKANILESLNNRFIPTKIGKEQADPIPTKAVLSPFRKSTPGKLGNPEKIKVSSMILGLYIKY